MLFLTREARLRFSMEDLFDGDGDDSRCSNGLRFSALKRFGDAESRFCQHRRGEFDANGEDSKGEESLLNIVC